MQAYLGFQMDSHRKRLHWKGDIHMTEETYCEDLFGPLPGPVVGPGEFKVGVMHFDHGHLLGMCKGLRDAGATICSFFDPDPAKAAEFLRSFPEARIAASEEEILRDPEIRLVAAAAVTCERADLGIRVMRAGKDYFTDKAPLTALEQLEEVRRCVLETGRKYMCYFSERLHNESAVFAERLIRRGAIGRVLSMQGFGPHRLNPPVRPAWFFEREKYGGILCDIGSHQIEQFLQFSGEEDAQVQLSRVANYNHPRYPGLEDYGDCVMVGKNGAVFYFRVDWFTPDGLRTWGDNRVFILGTEGTLELRKTVDPAMPGDARDVVILVNGDGERRFLTHGKVGCPFFGQLILDCLNRTENAMTQEHCFKAAELCVRASDQAVRIG